MIPSANCAYCRGSGKRMVVAQGQHVIPGWVSTSTIWVTCDCCILKPQVVPSQTTPCEPHRSGWLAV